MPRIIPEEQINTGGGGGGGGPTGNAIQTTFVYRPGGAAGVMYIIAGRH